MVQNNGPGSSNSPVPDGTVSRKERVGEILKRERERRQISIEAVAKKLRLNAKYIESLEANRYDELPGDTYIRVYLHSISSFLSLNSEEIFRCFFEERGLTGADTLRKDSSTKINLTAQEEKKPRTGLIVTFSVIALLAIFSFTVNRQGCHSSRTDKRAKTAVDIVGLGERGVVKKDAEAQAKLLAQAMDSQKVVRKEEKPVVEEATAKKPVDSVGLIRKPKLTADTLQKPKKVDTNAGRRLSKDSVKPMQAPAFKQIKEKSQVIITQPFMGDSAQKVSAKDTVKPARTVRDTPHTNRNVPDSVKKIKPPAARVQTDTDPMVLRMTVVGDSCWGRVFSDGGKEWKNTVLNGKGVTFTARDSFNVHVGASESVTFTLNGKTLQQLSSQKGVVTFKVDRSGTVTLWPLEKWNSVFERRF